MIHIPEYYWKIAEAVRNYHCEKFVPPGKLAVNPQDWAQLMATLDKSGKPLFMPQTRAVPDGCVGSIHGLPTYTDASLASGEFKLEELADV